MSRLPTFYIPHGGGPCFFMDWNPRDAWEPMARYLRGIEGGLPQPPKALLVISAHWEERVPTVLASAAPPLLFDYYGFPAHTYKLTWPAPGEPALAGRVQAMLSAAGIPNASDTTRGWDHGVFIPMKVAFPNANIPTVQLSLQAGLDPAAHLAIGRALAPLRDDGVLILGSGMSFHNMRMFGSPEALPASQRFDAWLTEAVGAPPALRDEQLRAWARAPGGRVAHPREEHLIPLMVAAGAGGSDAGRVVFRDTVLGAEVSAVQFG